VDGESVCVCLGAVGKAVLGEVSALMKEAPIAMAQGKHQSGMLECWRFVA
jgi:hypothetical protein